MYVGYNIKDKFKCRYVRFRTVLNCYYYIILKLIMNHQCYIDIELALCQFCILYYFYNRSLALFIHQTLDK